MLFIVPRIYNCDEDMSAQGLHRLIKLGSVVKVEVAFQMKIAGAMDLTGKADLDRAVETFKRVAAQYNALGVDVSRPIVLVVENLPIMGATEPAGDAFRLHIGVQAMSSGMLDGLIAHEVGHMYRIQQGHPSHSADVHGRLLSSVGVRGKGGGEFLAVARLALNHVEDIYADDLAFDVIGGERARMFFTDWIRRSTVSRSKRWETVANEVTVAFGLGNMERHGVQPEDIVLRETREFSGRAGLNFLPQLVAAFRDLPKTGDVETAIRELLIDVRDEGVGR